MPSVPCACAATWRPQRAASSTATRSSSSVYCCAPGGVPFDSTAPVARILMKSAPAFRFVRTALRISSGPSARFLTIGTSTIDRELPRVARAAGRGDVVAGDHQPGPRHDPLVNRLPQIDVGERPGRPHVAAGREAGRQRHQRVPRAVQRRLAGRRLQQLVFPVHAGAGQVRVQIDQARQQRRAAQIDDAGPCGNRQAGADRLDPLAADEHDSRRDRRAAAAVDEARGPHRDDRRRPGACALKTTTRAAIAKSCFMTVPIIRGCRSGLPFTSAPSRWRKA